MNKEFLNIHENLPSERIINSSFLTYFEDKHGFIYYSSGVGTHLSDSLVRAVLVYAPAEESNSKEQKNRFSANKSRTCLSRENSYEKRLLYVRSLLILVRDFLLKSSR